MAEVKKAETYNKSFMWKMFKEAEYIMQQK